MSAQYEDLSPDPWPNFYNLASRSATFEVYVADVKRDTLPDVVAALQASLSRIDRIVLGVPEVGDESLDSIEDGIAAMDEDPLKEIHVEGALRDIDVSIYLGEDELVVTVPADVAAPATSDASTPTEAFQTLVQFGLELCELTRARALYLLDETGEIDLPDGEWSGTQEPVWERSQRLWPPSNDDDESSDADEEANRLFDAYYRQLEARLLGAGFEPLDSSSADEDIEAVLTVQASRALGIGHSTDYCVIGYTTAVDPELVPFFAATAEEEIDRQIAAAGTSEHRGTTYVVIAAPVVAAETLAYLELHPHGIGPGLTPSIIVAVDLRNEEVTVNLTPETRLSHDAAGHTAMQLFGFD